MMSLELNSVSTTAIAAIITGIIGYILAYLKHMAVSKVNAHEERERAFTQLLDNYQKTVERQDKIVEHLNKLDEKINKLDKQMKNLGEGGLALLRDRIIQSCRFFIERGSIPLTEKTNIQDMYHAYHDIFGGNGVGEYYFNRMMALRIDDAPMISSIHLPRQEELNELTRNDDK